MEIIEEILNFVINHVDSKTSNDIVFNMKWVSTHYDDLLEIVRWTVPCVITSLTLFCLLASSSKVTE